MPTLRLALVLVLTSLLSARELPAQWKKLTDVAERVPYSVVTEGADAAAASEAKRYWLLDGEAALSSEACDVILGPDSIAPLLAEFRTVPRSLPELEEEHAAELRTWISNTYATPIENLRRLATVQVRRHSLAGEFEAALDLYETMVALGNRLMVSGELAGAWTYDAGRAFSATGDLPFLFGTPMKLSNEQRGRLHELLSGARSSHQALGLSVRRELVLATQRFEGKQRALVEEFAAELTDEKLEDPHAVADALNRFTKRKDELAFERIPFNPGLWTAYSAALLEETQLQCALRGNTCARTGEDPGPSEWLAGRLTSVSRDGRWIVDWKGDLMLIDAKLDPMTW